MPSGSSVRSKRKTADKKRLEFKCANCGIDATAPVGTNRATLKVCKDCFGKGVDRRPRQLNDLTGAEWARFSKSVEQYPDTRSAKQRAHGACFPKSLAAQQIQIFTKKGDCVFDPFVGVGTTLDVAMELGRNGIGIDLNAGFLKQARNDLRNAKEFGVTQTLILDDAHNLTAHIKPETVDFVLTSPPYASLLKRVRGAFAYKWREHSTIDPISNPRPYSSKPADLGNMPYDRFMESIQVIMKGCFTVLRESSYAIWVVKDYRDLKSRKPYVNVHGDVITAAEAAGFLLWDIRIYDQTQFRPLVCLGFPSRNFYLNIGHSYLLTFKKPKIA
jgi:DNA modification methylase